MHASMPHVPLPGSVHHPMRGAVPLGAVEPGEEVVCTLLLRRRPGSPDPHDFEHWQATPPAQRQVLSADECLRLFGAAEEELRAVLAFVADQGLRVIEADSGRRRVVVKGTAARMNAAFGITLELYRAPNLLARSSPPGSGRAARRGGRGDVVVYRGFAGPLHVPAALVDFLVGVLGLDNRPSGRLAGVAKPFADFRSVAAWYGLLHLLT